MAAQQPQNEQSRESAALAWLPSMLQTTDPLFPIGSYAHSYGLEELCSSGLVHDADSLLQYLKSIVYLNLQEFELPYLRFTYEAVQQQDFELLCELDQEIGASKPSRELRQASSAQGQQRLRLLSKLRPSPLFETLQKLKRADRLTPHHLSVFAAENATLQVPLPYALAAWSYQALAAPCAASLKLIRIGQEGAQSVLTHSLQDVDKLTRASLEVEREFAGAFLPLLDIASQRHEQAFSRLFIS